MLKLLKLFFSLLLIYYGWFQTVFYQIPNMLLILGALMMVTIVLHSYTSRINLLKYITPELWLWIAFAFASYVSGILMTHIRANTSSLFTYIEFLILIYGMIYISAQDKSIDFFVDLFILFATICSITTIFYGVEYSRGRISMGINSNPNLLGIIMAIAVCCILYKLNTKKLVYSIISFLLISIFIYTTILTGSRKSFLSIAIICLYWLIFVAFKEIRRTKFNGLILFIIVIIIAYYIMNTVFQDSLLFDRLSDLFESGDNTRKGMYIVAVQLFLKSPVWGIGFDNFKYFSGFGTYSHSTYAEALACTGLVGVFLYFSSYVILLKKYINLIFNKELTVIQKKQAKILLGLFFMLLFLGIGVIHFYGMSSSIAFGMIISFCNINKEYINAKQTD